MRHKFELAVDSVALIIAGVLTGFTAAGQKAPTVSLAEQLQAQYQLAKLSPDPNATNVVQPGTVLVIQKEGVFGVPPASTALCPSRYEDSNLESPDALCPPTAKKSSRSFKVGEKAYPSKIAVDVKNEKISFDITACDACNGTNPPTSFKSEVIFQFAKGYLEKASVPEVEDIIAQVFDIYTPPETPPAPAPEPSSQGSATPGQGLTNDDIIKLVQLKLGDSVIIAKIKSSACAFDTGTDALIRLKQASVSDAVLQAMIQGGVPSAAPASTPTASGAAPAPAPSASAPRCADYESCFKGGLGALEASQWEASLNYFQAASSMDPSKPDPWTELGYVYLGAGQYQDAVAMWDKALGLGGTLQLGVLYVHGLSSERATFRLSAKEVSLVGVSSARPAEVSSVKSAKAPFTTSSYFTMKIGDEKIYRIYYWPLGVGCEDPLYICGEPGPSQMEAVANYVAQTIGKLAPGSLAK